MRTRMFGPLRVYPEHDISFFFDRFHRVHIVVPDGQLRGGLPKWLGTFISTVSRSEMERMYSPETPVYGQTQAFELLIHGAEWKVRGRRGDRGLQEFPDGFRLSLQPCQLT